MSRHRTAMLERARPASAVAAGPRSSRRKRGLFRRTGIVLPAAVVAALVVAVVTVAAYLVSPNGSGASGLAQALDALPNSHSITMLEAEREHIIVMDAAAKTMNVASKPVMVSPTEVEASASAAADNSATSQDTVTEPPPDPGTAQQIGYSLLPSYGFNQTTQWSCLDQLWNEESGWVYNAENASGAYGIPQALPASKMASAGPDYLTDPTTQIKWGLGYITQVYGTPCAAWDHEEADGYY